MVMVNTMSEKKYKERFQEIGYRIAYCRKHMNMTQEQFAEALGVSRQHIGAIEARNVDRNVSLDLLFRIADLCEINASWFLGENNSSPFEEKE